MTQPSINTAAVTTNPGDATAVHTTDTIDADTVQAEIRHEQTVVDHIYTRLRSAADAARELAADGHARARLGNEGGLVERDAIVYQAGRRLATLDAAHNGLVFGRLDMRDSETRYIGRLGLRDQDREVLLIDWRAPAASVFYQATPAAPSDVVRRRVLQSRGERVTGIEDDLLDPENAPEDMPVVGEGALFAALTRSRDRQMHSVVATIQAEQDDVIRAPHRGVTTISGGPGTGKTVVALHRAAYLLYTDRRRYEQGGVLVVGPSPVFMAYIERVLPSLGETSVTLRAVGEMVEGIRAVRHDPPAVAQVKGSARMRRVLARTVRGPVPDGPTSFRTFYRDEVLVLTPGQLRSLRRDLLSSGQHRNRVAARVPEAVIEQLWQQVRGERAMERGFDDFAKAMEDDAAFTAFVAGWWPVVDAVDVLGWLADRDRLAADAGDVLSAAEVDDLAESLAADTFSVQDVPLLDELRNLLGEAPEALADPDPLAELYDDSVPEVSTIDDRGPIGGGDGTGGAGKRSQHIATSLEDDAFAHVLVDEAQDLSPMQWRMLGRRGRQASWTIVGDAAQSSWPLLDEAESAREETLRGKTEHSFRLGTNYRNAKEVFDLASDYAGQHIDAPDLPVAVRATGVEPEVTETTTPALPETTRAAVAQMAGELDGTVGVVVPSGRRREVERWLDPDRDPHRVPVLEALETKGLEFDGVVVVEPDLMVEESPAETGSRTLYVVLTRATQALHAVGTSHRWRP